MTISQLSEPGAPPDLSAGSNPALTSDDLPDPEGPHHGHQPLGGDQRNERPYLASRPKKSRGSFSSKAARPLYGLRDGTAINAGSTFSRAAARKAEVRSSIVGYRFSGVGSIPPAHHVAYAGGHGGQICLDGRLARE